MEAVALHDGDRQSEVGRELRFERDFQRVGPGVELDQPVAENLGPLESDQRQRRFFAPVKLNLCSVAQLVMVFLGENSQADGVVIAGDDDRLLTAHTVAEAVGRRRADDVTSRLVDP